MKLTKNGKRPVVKGQSNLMCVFLQLLSYCAYATNAVVARRRHYYCYYAVFSCVISLKHLPACNGCSCRRNCSYIHCSEHGGRAMVGVRVGKVGEREKQQRAQRRRRRLFRKWPTMKKVEPGKSEITGTSGKNAVAKRESEVSIAEDKIDKCESWKRLLLQAFRSQGAFLHILLHLRELMSGCIVSSFERTGWLSCHGNGGTSEGRPLIDETNNRSAHSTVALPGLLLDASF